MRRWLSKLTGTPSPSPESSRDSSPAGHHNDWPSSAITGSVREDVMVMPAPPSPCSAIHTMDIEWNVEFASDPCSWESAFDHHWSIAQSIIDDPHNKVNYEMVRKVFHHLGSMIQLLMMEANAQPESAIGPILDRYFMHQIMERIVDWALGAPHFLIQTYQINLIRLYEIIVGESHTQNHCLLVHKPILIPLFKLLDWCKSSEANRNFNPLHAEKHFVLLLNQICTKMAEDATLLHFFFTFNIDCDEQFLVFDLLIPYLYDSGDVGQLARDALLLILSVSRTMNNVALYIAIKSNFCPVVATGLSGCYSQLSRSIGSILFVSDDWHKIELDDVESFPCLLDFQSSLLFCNAVVQVAHQFVVSQLITYVYHGFLLPVVLPSLLQNGQDELISSTAYYHLCIESVTEPSLLQMFIKLLIVEKCEENKKVIDLIVDRISSGNRLSQVSLSLLRTLIDLRCEDVMFDLIFKYLLPCTHFLPHQTPLLKNQNYVRPAAQSLLSYIPECTQKSHFLCSQQTFQTYLNDSHKAVQKTADACFGVWSLCYDGRIPAEKFLKCTSDEENSSSGHTSEFVRDSSVRLSLLSFRSGINRYFMNRGMHTTAESLQHYAPLPNLGPSDSSPSINFLDDAISRMTLTAEEDSDTVNPAIMLKSTMMNSFSDYFQFAYGELSETENEAQVVSQLNNTDSSACKENSPSQTNGETDQESSFVLRGWGQVKDMDAFMALLNRMPKTKIKHSLEENMALIDSRIQYINELKAENTSGSAHDPEQNSLSNMKADDQEVSTVIGQSLELCDNQGVGPFLDSLLRSLDEMLDNSIYLNLQVTSVLSAITTYTHPLIAHYLFNQQIALQPGIKNLFKILESLKSRIDKYLSSLDGYDVLLDRGIKFMRARAERYERASDSARQQNLLLQNCKTNNSNESSRQSQKSFLGRFHPFNRSSRRYDANDPEHPHEFRFYSHKAMESRDVTMDHARAKQIVFSAIILSQFCQELAANVLQHSLVVAHLKNTTTNL